MRVLLHETLRLRSSCLAIQTTRLLTRSFGNISVHTRVPATIYRLQQTPQSNLVEPDPSGAGVRIDEVEITPERLVKIGLSRNEPVFNGALFMPNTHAMQELTRDAFDAYIEDDELCKPVLVQLAKGIAIPQDLLLLRSHSQLVLQCSRPHTLRELNQRLDEFYNTQGTFLDAGEWFTVNDFANATSDEDVSQAMSQ